MGFTSTLYANDQCEAKIVRGLHRYPTGFGRNGFNAGRFTGVGHPSISRSHLVVWQWRRQEPVSTSAENALWCRDFAAGKVILSIDIKGLAERHGLWRVV
jgi:hypothetical protein